MIKPYLSIGAILAILLALILGVGSRPSVSYSETEYFIPNLVAASDAPDDVKAIAGYVVTGYADDEIQDAIDDTEGKLLLIGTFSTNATVYLDENTWLAGDGNTVINSTNTGIVRLFYADDAGDADNLKISDLTINYLGVVPPSNRNIDVVSGSSHIIIDNVHSSGGQIVVTGCSDVSVTNCHTSNQSMIGVNSSTDVRIIDNYCEEPFNVCIITGSSDRVVISGNTLVGNLDSSGLNSAIDIGSASEAIVANNSLTNFNTGIGGDVRDDSQWTIDGNRITGWWDESTYGQGTFISMSLASTPTNRTERVVVQNNVAYNYTGYGVLIYGVNYLTIKNNTFDSINGSGIRLRIKTISSTDYYCDNAVINGNVIRDFGQSTLGGAFYGVLVQSSCHSEIKDNSIDGGDNSAADYGIYTYGSSDYNYIMDNIISNVDITDIYYVGANDIVGWNY